jgi:hypothetical protein
MTGRERVFAELFGGLGNQMFQYAAGRALADRLNASLTLVNAHNGRDGEQTNLLAPFDLDVPVVSRWIRDPYRHSRRLLKNLERLRSDRRRSSGLKLLESRQFHVLDKFFTIDSGAYLVGYWQSPRYFGASADRIRKEFALDRFARPRTADRLSAIVSRPTVSVHVRRGDYVRLSRGDGAFRLCDRDYYDRARALLDRMEPDLHYVVFSDEPDAAEELLGDWEGCTFVAGLSPYEDMLLMSRCRHHIIANSTFGWWPAWLDDRPETIVIAPRLWFSRRAQISKYVLDLFPEHWVLL